MRKTVCLTAALFLAACAGDKGKDGTNGSRPQGCSFVLEKISLAATAGSAYRAAKKCGLREDELERILESEETGLDSAGKKN